LPGHMSTNAAGAANHYYDGVFETPLKQVNDSAVCRHEILLCLIFL